jgi:hypothetical protein
MDLTPLLAASRASDAFKADVRRFVAHGAAERLATTRYSPPVKVMRVVAQLLHAHPELSIDRVSIDARSGCADFTGVVHVEAGGCVRRFEFSWDCRWRAEQQGYSDYFGFPDQIRAASEFGWRCFRHWTEQSDPLATLAPDDELDGQLSAAG